MNHPLGTASADWRERLAERTTYQSGVQGSGKHPETRGQSEAHPATERGTVCPTESQFGVALAAGGSPAPCGCCGGSGIWWKSDDETVTVICVDCDGTGIEGEDR